MPGMVTVNINIQLFHAAERMLLCGKNLISKIPPTIATFFYHILIDTSSPMGVCNVGLKC